jgi:hypothetical protein
MADVYKVLAQLQLPGSVGTLYTVSASTMTIVRNIVLLNCDTVDREVQLFLNGTADANRIAGTPGDPVVLVPGERAEFNSVMTMAAANTIRGFSDAASKVTISIFGLEIGV